MASAELTHDQNVKSSMLPRLVVQTCEMQETRVAIADLECAAILNSAEMRRSH